MASAQASIELQVPPDQVWQLIGGFGSLPDWLPYIPHSDLLEGGRMRRLTSSDGGVIIEQLEQYDEANRTYSYSIKQAPFPIEQYLATISVAPTEQGSIVQWSGIFTPLKGREEEAHDLFQSIFSKGLQALAERYSASGRGLQPAK